MLADYGFYLLFLAFISTIYGVLVAISAATTRQRKFLFAAKLSSSVTLALSLGAAAILLIYLIGRDFSIAYVYKNSSLDLPLRYTISAFWAALEGSHFLWTLFLTFFSCLAHHTYTKTNEALMPFISLSLNGLLAWMFFLAITFSDPFKLQFPLPQNGLGLNTLLQNPYMVFHPPFLFIGYTASSIPFAYSIAALFYGNIPEGWLRTTRRWSLIGWFFLTLGIFLGGRWAYVELGWAGYWAWDPVENSSFLPWLFSTSLLHSLYVQENTGHLKRLTLILSFLSLFFSFFGTFITRSGIVSSVHSFAQSPIGPYYLYFLLFLALAFILLYAYRAPAIIPPANDFNYKMSRESLLIITQYLLGIFAVIVIIGTLYPLLSELVTGSRIDVQAPYFNAFAPYIGFLLIVGIVFGNFSRFRSKKLGHGNKVLVTFVLPASFLTLLFLYFGNVFRSYGYAFAMQSVGSFLCFWAMLCLIYNAWIRLKSNSLNKQFSYLGSIIAHLGIFIAILGFLGNYRGINTIVTLKEGESTQFYGYDLKFSGMKIKQQENAEIFVAPLVLTHNGKQRGVIQAARAKYPTKAELINEVGISDHFWHDVYVVLSDFSKTGHEATFQIHINHTVRIVWISLLFLLFGAFICLLDRKRGSRLKKDNLMDIL